MGDQPPAYATNPSKGDLEGHPYPQGSAQPATVAYPPQPSAYPPQQAGPYPQGQGAYPQGQAVGYPQGQPVGYPQGQPAVYPQGQGVTYPAATYPQGQAAGYPQVVSYGAGPGQTVVMQQPGVAGTSTTQYVYQHQSGNQDCCGSGVQSDQYKASAGFCTGVFQLVLGILSIILGGASYAFSTIQVGYGIWGGLMFFIPTGILGIMSRQQRSCMITAYLVLCIFCTLQSFGMLAYESTAASVYSLIDTCYFNYFTYSYECSSTRSVGAIFVHAILAVIALIEFIVSIVAAAFCCKGLACCCANQPSSTTTTQQTMYQTPGVAQPINTQQAPVAAAAQPGPGEGKDFSKI